MLVDKTLLRGCLSLLHGKAKSLQRRVVVRTVSSLIRVDFPAPLGPTTPTRLYIDVIIMPLAKTPGAHLDKDKAQLAPNRLGVLLPGYVNVQLDNFRIARVLLRTPISDPGGGKKNLTEVAASA